MNLKVKRIIYNSLHTLLALLIVLVSFVGVIFFAINLTYQSTYVYGMSMQPTVNNGVVTDEEQGDLVLVNRYADPNVGDIVIATPNWSTKTVIKRLIGTPGDKIRIDKLDKYYLYCNDKLIYTRDLIYSDYYEKYKNALDASNKDYIELGKDEYFIMGDNWANSADSITRGLKTISKKELVGKVDIIIDKSESKFWGILKYGLEVLFKI